MMPDLLRSTVVALLVLLASSVNASNFVDVSNGGLAVLTNFSNTGIAQSFRPQRTRIAGASFRAQGLQLDDEFQITLMDAIPTGNALASGRVSNLNGEQDIIVSWPAIDVSTSVTYYLMINRTAGSQPTAGLELLGQFSGSYPDGQAYYRDFAPHAGEDFNFASYAPGPKAQLENGSVILQPSDTVQCGRVIYQGTPSQRTFTVRNVGEFLTLNLQGANPISFTGAGAAHFQVVAQITGSIALAASRSFDVRYNPQRAGAHTATLNIAFTNEVTAHFQVSGLCDGILPGPPTPTGSTGAYERVSIAFSSPVAPYDGGFDTGSLSYTATCEPGSLQGTSSVSPIVVNNLINYNDYSCRLNTTNPIGKSVYSFAIGVRAVCGVGNCQDCTSDSSCTKCFSPYYLFNGVSPPNCTLSCPWGYWNNANAGTPTCTACDSRCTVCTSATACQVCASGYFLYAGDCFRTSCPMGTYTQGQTCRDCASQCSGCGSATNCTSCKPGYNLEGQSCRCPANKLDTGTSCVDQCPAGYYAGTSGKCERCYDSMFCTLCHGGGPTDCRKCSAGVLTNGACSLNCDNGLVANPWRVCAENVSATATLGVQVQVGVCNPGPAYSRQMIEDAMGSQVAQSLLVDKSRVKVYVKPNPRGSYSVFYEARITLANDLAVTNAAQRQQTAWDLWNVFNNASINCKEGSKTALLCSQTVAGNYSCPGGYIAAANSSEVQGVSMRNCGGGVLLTSDQDCQRNVNRIDLVYVLAIAAALAAFCGCILYFQRRSEQEQGAKYAKLHNEIKEIPVDRDPIL